MSTTERPRPWIHVAGVVVTVLAAGLAFVAFVAASFGTAYCDEPSASQTTELRRSVFAIVVAFSGVPFLVGLVARNRGSAHRPWYGVALASLAFGSILALTVEQSQWCF